MITRARKREINDGIWYGFNGAFLALLALALILGWRWPRPVTLSVPMPGYGLPVCASEDSTPVGGCVWPSDDAVWINYPGRA